MAGQSPTRILFADDDVIIRRVMETRLRKAGFEITTVEGGRAALKQLGLNDEGTSILGGSFDLVLSDQMMPEVSGMDLLRRIRQTVALSELPVIMVTAKNRPEDVVAALHAGANDYVSKPIDFEVLLARMAAHLEVKRAHAALRASHRALVQAARVESVGHLAAGVAHEIRNPLAQIQMGLDGVRQMVGGMAGDNAMVGEMLDLVTDAVTRADEIVTQLVAISTAKRLTLEATDLNDFVRDNLDMLAGELTAAGVRVEFTPAAAPVVALAAGNELRQVFVNVMLNAMEAMPAGGRVTVRTSEGVAAGIAHHEGARVGAVLRDGEPVGVIEIDDAGPGIPEAGLAKVFDPFFTGKAAGAGKGLGLTVARQLMELHGGAIQLHNLGDGRGLRVTLLLRTRETAML